MARVFVAIILPETLERKEVKKELKDLWLLKYSVRFRTQPDSIYFGIKNIERIKGVLIRKPPLKNNLYERFLETFVFKFFNSDNSVLGVFDNRENMFQVLTHIKNWNETLRKLAHECDEVLFMSTEGIPNRDNDTRLIESLLKGNVAMNIDMDIGATGSAVRSRRKAMKKYEALWRDTAYWERIYDSFVPYKSYIDKKLCLRW